MPEPTSSASQNADPALDKNTVPAKTPRRDPALEARDELLARADKYIEDERAAEYQRFLESTDVDPRAAALAVQMQKEAKGEALDVDRGHRDLEVGAEEAEPTQVIDGAASVERMAPAARPAVREAQRISTKGEDPLGDYVVRVDGKPMFKTVVDGQERLIPLDRARQQLQLHLAADTRFDQAKELKRQVEEEKRQLAARAAAPAATPAAPQVDDMALATGLVRSLLSEPEDKAAAKMAETFKTIRAAAAPRIDEATLITRARDEAVRTIAERDNRRALEDGLNRFTQDYPEIASDPDLFALADKRTTGIAEANPTWTPAQVMSEAGKQIREKFGTKAPAREDAPNNRQQRKQNLVPMPQPRVARPAPAPATQEDNSPQAMMAEIRKSRGQPG